MTGPIALPLGNRRRCKRRETILWLYTGSQVTVCVSRCSSVQAILFSSRFCHDTACALLLQEDQDHRWRREDYESG